MQPWMLFRKQDCSAHYFWDGDFPILVQIAKGEVRENHYWDGPTPVTLPDKWIKKFNEIAQDRTRVFKFNDVTFNIVEKGVFKTE